MTNKQLAKLLRETGNLLFDRTYDPNEKLLLDEAADRLENQNKWISVEDRLPEKFKDVLCLYPSKNYGSNIVVDYMESDRGYFAEQFRYGEPTHWMPLPELPTEKEK